MRADDKPVLRRCARCGETKPVDQFYPRKRGGYRSDCIPCSRESSHQWRNANPEQVREKNHRWRTENPERARELNRRWYAENPERVRELNRRWRAENPERARESTRRWQTKNAERMRVVKRTVDVVRRAIGKGVLVRPSVCEGCGATGRQITAAHHDYARPLDVRWLCRSCHSMWDSAEPKTL